MIEDAIRRIVDLRESVLNPLPRRRPTLSIGKNAGPTPAFTGPPNVRFRSCSPRKSLPCSPCPSSPFVTINTVTARCIWTGAWKSKPPTTARRRDGSGRVRVQWDGTHVRLLDPKTGQLLREHRCQERGRHRIQEADRPPRTATGTVQLLARAAKEGPPIGTFWQVLHKRQGEPSIRRILGILSFHKTYGVARVDEACAAALDPEAYDYRFVKRYLKRVSPLQLSLQQVDPLIRELTQYRDLIEERTKEPNP